MNAQQLHMIEEPVSPSAEASSEPAQETDILSMDDQLNMLRTTNWNILNYFRSAYITQSEQIQNLKSELFELDVKIEELQKTKDIYSFRSDNSRNIFSPLPSTSANKGKGQAIQTQLDELQEVRISLTKTIQSLDEELITIRNHITDLEHSNQCLASLYQNLPQPEETAPVKQAAEPSRDETKEDDNVLHAARILMFHEFDKSQTAERIRTLVQQNIEANQNKLEVLKWLLQSDPTRARLTLQELQDSNERLLHAADQIIEELDHNANTTRPIWLAIDDCVQSYRQQYPDCTVNASVDCTDYDMRVLPIITITVVQLLRDVMDNIFYYSNANKILIKIYINSRMIDIYVNDNGVGIPADYLSGSPWHSGLHRLHEIVHLLDGKVQIDGDIISGTNVRFSLPIRLVDDPAS